MRGFFLFLTVALAAAGAAVRVDAGEGAKARAPEFRLLELGGRTVRWTVPAGGLPAIITYAFVTQPVQFAGARNCDAMLPPEAALTQSGIATADFRREVRAAFSLWEKAANIVFRETADTAAAGILIGADAKARGRAFTNVALKDEAQRAAGAGGMGAIRQSLICLNPKQPWKIGFDGDLNVYDVRFTLAHEIGHAIGLDHPSPEGQLMSFRYVEAARGLMPGDVAGAVALYGRPGGGGPAPEGAPIDTAARPAAPAQGHAFGLGEPEAEAPQR